MEHPTSSKQGNNAPSSLIRRIESASSACSLHLHAPTSSSPLSLAAQSSSLSLRSTRFFSQHSHKQGCTIQQLQSRTDCSALD